MHSPLSGLKEAPWAKQTMRLPSGDMKRSLRYCIGTFWCGQLLRYTLGRPS